MSKHKPTYGSASRVMCIIRRLALGPASISQLMDGTDMSERTIYRYIRHLKSLDVPIEHSNMKYWLSVDNVKDL